MTIKVVIFSGAYDTGGQGFRIKQAFDRYQPFFSVRSVHTLEGYFDYPRDLRKGGAEVKGLLESADILHMVNGVEGLEHLGATALRGLVVHHRGTKFREDHRRLAAEAEEAGAVQMASTIDLTVLEPGISWMPSPYEIEEIAQLRTTGPSTFFSSQRPFRVAHAPTNRIVKSTKAVMAAILELNDRGMPTVLDLIERKPWTTTLERKAKADVYVDQLHLGYGNNAIEAWAMGLPVVAGSSNPQVNLAMMQAWGVVPFYAASEATLADRLLELAIDPSLRAHCARVGYEHVMKWHGAETVSYRLASVYEAALRKGVNHG